MTPTMFPYLCVLPFKRHHEHLVMASMIFWISWFPTTVLITLSSALKIYIVKTRLLFYNSKYFQGYVLRPYTSLFLAHNARSYMFSLFLFSYSVVFFHILFRAFYRHVLFLQYFLLLPPIAPEPFSQILDVDILAHCCPSAEIIPSCTVCILFEKLNSNILSPIHSPHQSALFQILCLFSKDM